MSSVRIPCRPFPSQDSSTAVCGAAEQLSAATGIMHVSNGQGVRFPTGTRIKTDSPLPMALSLRRAADHTPPHSAGVKNARSCTFTPPYVFMT
jgi:hypothetical protein